MYYVYMHDAIQTRAEILEKVVDKIKSLKEENEHLKLKIDSLPQPGQQCHHFCMLYFRLYSHKECYYISVYCCCFSRR